MNQTIEDQVIKKMALEAFEMVFDGHLSEASQVFEALDCVRPDNEALFIGGALVNLLSGQPIASSEAEDTFDIEPVLNCFRSLQLLEEGNVNEARMLLEKVKVAGDLSAERLANAILKNEFVNSF